MGQPAVVRVPGKRFGCNVISALTNKGQMSFMVFEGRFRADKFIEFCERLIKQSRRKVFLIVDGHPAHRAKLVKDWTGEHAQRIAMFFLPGYAPDLNPDELLNGDIKRAVGQARPRDREAMKTATRNGCIAGKSSLRSSPISSMSLMCDMLQHDLVLDVLPPTQYAVLLSGIHTQEKQSWSRTLRERTEGKPIR